MPEVSKSNTLNNVLDMITGKLVPVTTKVNFNVTSEEAWTLRRPKQPVYPLIVGVGA